MNGSGPHSRVNTSSQAAGIVGVAKHWRRAAMALVGLVSVATLAGCALTSGAHDGAANPSLAISTPALPQGQLQSQYQVSLSATGGKEPYTWALLSGSLPIGLSLTSSTGTISGRPTQSGTSTFTIGVEDASSPIGSARSSMAISIKSATSALEVSTGNLPSGTVRESYDASLSASGGTAPYKWSMAGGQLPAGLTLSSAGEISGTPTTAQQNSFTVEVTDASSTTAKAALAISVASTASTLKILTASLPSGTVQVSYSASLSATGGSAPYNWSVLSGQLPAGLSLSSSGAITGIPTMAIQDSFVVEVSDSASPTGTARATLTLGVAPGQTGGGLQISSAALPAGTSQTSYVATLLVSGGTAPYTWSLASGQLPAGLTLSRSGEISGTPSTTGQSSFVVEAADSSVPEQTATQDFEITISSQGQSGSGPYTSRTDHDLIPLPVPLPSVGGATGAGKCVSQPGYDNLVCRATDIDTLGAGNTDVLDQEFSTCCGGWADLNAWNSNSTMFFVSTNGGGLVVMHFDPATQAVAPLYGQPLLAFAGGWWSYSNPELAYSLAGGTKDPIIISMTITSQTTPPQPVTIADLATAPNCVPSLAGTTAWRELAVSRDEQTFLVGAGTGIQGSATYVIVYNLSNGCRWFNTQTGQIGGNWGPTGAAETSDSYLLHSVRISGDGQTVIVTPSAGSGPGSAYRHFWTIASLAVTTGSANATNGHFSTGYSGYVNTTNYTANGQWCKLGMSYRTFANLSNPIYVLPTLAQCADTELAGDDHASWNNDDTSDQQPFFTTPVTNPLGTPISTAWQNEAIGYSMTNPGTVWRFLSTYSTGTSQFFTCQNGIGTVSQDGKWFIFTSDWGNTLGVDGAGSNRCDVFIAQLK